MGVSARLMIVVVELLNWCMRFRISERELLAWLFAICCRCSFSVSRNRTDARRDESRYEGHLVADVRYLNWFRRVEAVVGSQCYEQGVRDFHIAHWLKGRNKTFRKSSHISIIFGNNDDTLRDGFIVLMIVFSRIVDTSTIMWRLI